MFESLRAVWRFRELELNPVKRRLGFCANINDLRLVAKKKLPAPVFDYIDGGAEDETTMAANKDAYRRLGFVPRVLRDVATLDPSTTLLGKPTQLPLVFAPTGFTRIADPQGELAVARAAARFGIPCSLSTLGTRSIEDVAAASDSVSWGTQGERRLWFQVYVWRDRALAKEMLDRCADANYEAIFITADTPYLGRRERDVRRGLVLPPKLGVSTIIDGMRKPVWTWRFLNDEPIVFANVTTSSQSSRETDGSDPVDLADHLETQFDPSLTWADLEWFRSNWNKKIIVKGIQSVADASLCVQHGVDAICLSNHGGRQLDGAPAPASLIAPCRQVVGDQIEIIADGGVRRGSDIVKACALGADAVMAGRPYLYALGAAGELGVDWLLDFFADGMRRSMALCGAATVDELTPEMITQQN